MFARFITLLPLAALAAVAVAVPNAPEARTTSPTCNSGSVYCCNKTFTNKADFKKDPTGLLGIFGILGINGGVGCTPITVIGALSDGAKCTQQTACCSDVKQDGVVNFVCNPVNVGA